MINVVISLYYYLLILKAAYLLEPEEVQAGIQLSTPIKMLTGALVAVMIIFGIYPHHLIELTKAAARMLN